jgi:repressor LexA
MTDMTDINDKLTIRQAEILELIRAHIDISGYPPTRAEICKYFGFRSPNAAEQHLRALERKGAIEIAGGSSRGIRLTEASGLPLIGRVAAGSPILAVENVEERYQMDSRLFNPRPDYLLRVQGMSMRDAGILDGDLLAVHSTPEARNGQIVVARLEDEVTVKRFQRQGNTIRLLPENPEFNPIEIELSHQAFAIEGLGVGIIRHGSPL